MDTLTYCRMNVFLNDGNVDFVSEADQPFDLDRTTIIFYVNVVLFYFIPMIVSLTLYSLILKRVAQRKKTFNETVEKKQHDQEPNGSSLQAPDHKGPSIKGSKCERSSIQVPELKRLSMRALALRRSSLQVQEVRQPQEVRGSPVCEEERIGEVNDNCGIEMTSSHVPPRPLDGDAGPVVDEQTSNGPNNIAEFRKVGRKLILWYFMPRIHKKFFLTSANLQFVTKFGNDSF